MGSTPLTFTGLSGCVGPAEFLSSTARIVSVYGARFGLSAGTMFVGWLDLDRARGKLPEMASPALAAMLSAAIPRGWRLMLLLPVGLFAIRGLFSLRVVRDYFTTDSQFTVSGWMERLAYRRAIVARADEQSTVRMSAVMNADLNEPEVYVEDLGVQKRVPKHAEDHYARALSAVLKQRFPYFAISSNTADLLSVQAAAVVEMTKHGLRPAHRAALMPRIVAAVFTPSKEDIELKGLMQSRAAEDARDRYASGTIDHWLDRWTGRTRRFTVKHP